MSEIFVHGDIMPEEDLWVWKFTRNEVYLAKSGYDISFLLHNFTLIQDQIARPSLNPLRATLLQGL